MSNDMSVKTTAAQKVEEAVEHLHAAATALNHITFEKCWGADDFRPEFLARLRHMTNEILEFRDELNR